MTSARAKIFGAISRALGPHDNRAAIARLKDRPAGPRPMRAQGSPQDLLARFEAEVTRASAELISIGDPKGVPDAIRSFAMANQIDGPIRVAPALRHLDWGSTGHNVMFDKADLSVYLGVSRGFAGIAETGTVVLASSADDPMLLAFVAEVHVIVLSRADIMGSLEEALAKVTMDGVPRSVSMVSGPSRTGDIEMTLQYGAHGPKRLAILLTD